MEAGKTSCQTAYLQAMVILLMPHVINRWVQEGSAQHLVKGRQHARVAGV